MLFGRRAGRCRALRWQSNHLQYRCGAITSAQEVLRVALPRFAHGTVPLLAWLLERWAGRWIALGIGCDCDVQSLATELPPTESQSGR